MSEATDAPVASASLTEQVKGMEWNFWISNLIEAGERLAFFGVRSVLPLFMVGTGASELGLSYSEKGIIYGVWAFIQCIVPMVSGGYTDTYGYKRSLYVAFGINIGGYVIMANAGGFWSMMLAGVCVGTGTAIFKPPVQGTVAKSLSESNSGLGFGIFYFLVNVGGFLAPMAASYVRGNEANPTWHYVFYGAAFVTAFNYLPAIFLFREPEIAAEDKEKSPWAVFSDTMLVLWRDKPMLRLLLIISGFWFMFMQLWDLLPNFIDEWIDTHDVGAFLVAWLGDGARGFLTVTGAAKPEILINVNAASILLLVLPLSWLFGRFNMMKVMALGMGIGLIGFIGSGMTSIGAICALMIFCFSIGEILCSPKFSEFIGMTAPPDKKATYMGYSNIPFAIGWGAGNILSGPLYDNFASRTAFAKDYLVTKMGMTAEAVNEIKPDELLRTISTKMGENGTIEQAQQALWDTYNPWIVWVMLGVVGFASLIGILVSYQMSQKPKA